ncbi:StbA family protein [Kosakonia cowanii]|nr:StbA family protein [Kosakonia cowanii]
MNVFIDDGSTNVKLAWFDGEELKTHVSPNSFRTGWAVDAFGTGKTYNYEVNGNKYTFAPADHRVQKTTNLHYQYDTLNLLAVHHAMETAGLPEGEYEVVVTLPISEFYSSDNQRNVEKIERKIQNLTGEVLVGNKRKFTLTKVAVVPESIPAVMRQLEKDNVIDMEKSLVIDLGGTTLDCGVITGKYDSVYSVHGNPEIGVSVITEKVKSALAMANSETSDYVADLIIQRRNDEEFLSKVINDKSKITGVKKVITNAIEYLSSLVVSDIERYSYVNRVYLVGGGASLIEAAVRAKFDNIRDKVLVIENPQLALVTEMAYMGR